MKFRKLYASEIEARVNTITENGCGLLLYKDARVDQNLLDETVGPENWQRSHQLIGANLYCTVSIYDQVKGCWISKQDVGTESNTEKEKGQASDSFKRACFNWGIGRELYTAPRIWIKKGDVNIEEGRNGKCTTYDTFTVKDIGYDERGEICKLAIWNNKKNKYVFRMGAEDAGESKITAKEVETLKALCERKGCTLAQVFPQGAETLTGEQYAEAVKRLGALKDKK